MSDLRGSWRGGYSTPMQKASGRSVRDVIAALRLLHREEIQAGALGRRALDTSGARREEHGKSRVVRAATHLRPFCITPLEWQVNEAAIAMDASPYRTAICLSVQMIPPPLPA